MEEKPSFRCAGVDVLSEDFQGDSAFADICGCLDDLG